MAAAARELRPVEIVGLYETRREAAEQEVAAWRAEVRRGCMARVVKGNMGPPGVALQRDGTLLKNFRRT